MHGTRVPCVPAVPLVPSQNLPLPISPRRVPIPLRRRYGLPALGTDMPPSTQHRPGPAAPPVRVEVRHGAAPPVGLDVTGDEFVIGSVPGCDLRIPGANLPPQVCSIRRGPDGVRLKKIAQALPILLNGSPIAPAGQAILRHGDVISVGAVDLHVSIAFSVPEPVPVSYPS